MSKICKENYFFTILLLALFIVIILSLSLGKININIETIMQVFLNKLGLYHNDLDDVALTTIWYLRLPRIIVAVLVGMALGVSGAVMQGVLQNPMADPSLMGISAGACLGAIVAISFGFMEISQFLLPTFAFVGSGIALSIVLFLSIKNGKIPIMIVLLSGIVVSMFLGAITTAILTFINEQELQKYLFWMIGSLDTRRWDQIYFAIVPISLSIIILCILAKHLNILSLGEIEAKGLGMNVFKYRIMFLALASLGTAVSVCIAGSIGFIGLIIPHMMRFIVGYDYRILLPVSGIAGAIFLVLCDTIGRIILPYTEVKAGIVCSLIGAPYFLYLLNKIRKDKGF